MTFTILPKSLDDVLRHLDEATPVGRGIWRDASIEKIEGGKNNLLYRVQQEDQDLAVKFTIKDERNRARREFVALSALHQAGIEVTPKGLWLDETSFNQPVVIQSWIEGQTLDGVPQNKERWDQLVDHFVKIHSLKKQEIFDQVPMAVLGFQNGEQGKKMVLEHAAVLPEPARPKVVKEVLSWFENWSPPNFPQAQLALCRSDANWCNFIQQQDQLASVDWENSGWGDPAFEIADLMAHPAYEGVEQNDWDYVIEKYVDLTGDQTNEIRIRTYYVEMLMWWVIRWARYLYEIPLGLDQRLVKRDDDWKSHTEWKLKLELEKLKEAMEKKADWLTR